MQTIVAFSTDDGLDYMLVFDIIFINLLNCFWLYLNFSEIVILYMPNHNVEYFVGSSYVELALLGRI